MSSDDLEEIDEDEEEEEIDPPLTPEEEEEFRLGQEEMEREYEREATELYGPAPLRKRKNQWYINWMFHRHSEPVVRGLLLTLSRLERPLCAHWLSRYDLQTVDLSEVVRHFDIRGTSFRIISVEGGDYTVAISAGYGNAGDGGKFVISHRDGEFVLKKELEFWLA